MHYIVDINKKLNNVSQLIERGKYFVINRPRQYGKTTLYMLERTLENNEEYY
jgi:hypothetical protein